MVTPLGNLRMKALNAVGVTEAAASEGGVAALGGGGRDMAPQEASLCEEA
jgi:hypothetical protein